jgi:putative heme transporter
MDELGANTEGADTGGTSNGMDHPVHPPEALGIKWTKRGVLGTVAFVALSIAALYFVLPKLVGLRDTWNRIQGGNLWWFGLAAALEILSFLSYIALFRIVFVRDTTRISWRVSYQITMAGLAATRLLASAGAGGIALTAWALRRSGMATRTVGSRMVAFMVLLYAVYMVTLIVGGVGLYLGLFPGPAPFAITVGPAIFGGVVVGLVLALTAIPTDFEALVSRWAGGEGWFRRLVRRVAAAPAVLSTGVRDALTLIRARESMLLGAVGWWGFDIAVLWACFHAFGKAPPQAVIVMAYFVGMLGNVLPLPGGIGGVDGGMIGAFTAFGVDVELSIVAVLAYRAFAFWLPTIPGAVAYLQLRRTVQRWRNGETPQPTRPRRMARSYT